MQHPAYLLDTNVVSETRRARPNQRVMAFIEHVADDTLFISALTIGELQKGVELKRRNDPVAARHITIWIEETQYFFAERILPVDIEIARLWGVLSADRGRPIVDTLIVATAMIHGLTLVTRNTADFQGLRVRVVNPWEARP